MDGMDRTKRRRRIVSLDRVIVSGVEGVEEPGIGGRGWLGKPDDLTERQMGAGLGSPVI